MTDAMLLNMGDFEALDYDEMMDVDGGNIGQALALTGGSVAFAWGTMFTAAGVILANPAIAGGGFVLACGGAAVILDNMK